MAIDERNLIESVLAPLTAGAPGAFGLRDDAAVIAPEAGAEHVVTLDTLVEGVHFRVGDPAGAVARKALRVNLSDLAAKGAEAFAWFLSLALPADLDEDWMAEFAAGLADDQRHYGIDLHGGDTVRSPGPIVITVTVIGRCPAGTSVRRFGARPGDLLYVSGTIGDGALGLFAGGVEGLDGLDPEAAGFLAGRYLLPEPRCGLAPAVRAHARAAMDVSDGLVNDLGLMCEAGGVGAEVEIARVPLSGPARAALEAHPDLLASVLAGGDDYELLAALAPEAAAAYEAAAAAAGIAVTRIGRVLPPGPARFLDEAGKAVDLPRTTFRHF